MEPATPVRNSKATKRGRPGTTSTPRSNKGRKTLDSRKPNTNIVNVTDNSSSAAGKSSKGLRHFSKHVCNKLEEKQCTSYNEVADELVTEFLAERSAEDDASSDGAATGKKKRGAAGHDEKNIRRRVYDALNVLDALNIISKEKKQIKWKGLPSRTSSDLKKLQSERDACFAEVKKKKELMQDLIVQRVCFGNLARRNADDNERNQRARNAPSIRQEEDKIPLPFIVVNASSSAIIQVDINEDQTEVMFDFNMPFEMSDDNAILKRLGLNKTSEEEISKMLPPDLLGYCKSNNLLDSITTKPSKTSSYQNSTYRTQESRSRHHQQEQDQVSPPYPVRSHSGQTAPYNMPPRHSNAYRGVAPHPSDRTQHPQQLSFEGYSGSATAPSSFHPPSY